jgi:hypothetical protein
VAFLTYIRRFTSYCFEFPKHLKIEIEFEHLLGFSLWFLMQNLLSQFYMMQMHLITNMGCYSSTHLTRISTPRFLGKKRGKGHNDLHRPTFSLFSWRGWYVVSRWVEFFPLGSSFQMYGWEERITLERWIFTKIEYLIVNSWKEISQWYITLINMKHKHSKVGNCFTIDKNMKGPN